MIDKFIRSVRRIHDVSVDELANYCRVTAFEVDEIETGVRVPAREFIEAFSELFEVDMSIIEMIMSPRRRGQKWLATATVRIIENKALKSNFETLTA